MDDHRRASLFSGQLRLNVDFHSGSRITRFGEDMMLFSEHPNMSHTVFTENGKEWVAVAAMPYDSWHEPISQPRGTAIPVVSDNGARDAKRLRH